jgi:hypothetical protein
MYVGNIHMPMWIQYLVLICSHEPTFAGIKGEHIPATVQFQSSHRSCHTTPFNKHIGYIVPEVPDWRKHLDLCGVSDLTSVFFRTAYVNIIRILTCNQHISDIH